MRIDPEVIDGLECVVLAGGLGSRLRDVINDVPKVLAPINGKPFLFYLLKYLERQNASRVILALGYRSEQVEIWLKENEFKFEITLSIEEEPLGTGGALIKAIKLCHEDNIVFLNGDTYFDIDLKKLYLKSVETIGCRVSLAILRVEEPHRYGTVICDSICRIIEFKEKSIVKEGLINGGVGVINREFFLNNMPLKKFSLEKDFFEKFVSKGGIFGIEFNSYFIDIGVPNDYEKAQIDLRDIL
jgi:D-glycero-alpha-D-manno-heptose 1-phosphate guanylyltransferase